MNLKVALTTLAILAFGCLAARLLAQRKGRTSKDLTLALGLFSGTGVLLAMGSIEMAGRYGYSVILALIGFTLVFVFSPVIFSPIRRLSQIIRFATPVDFLTFRYRTKTVAVIACSALMLAIIPLILAQFAAMDSIANRLIGVDYQLAFQLDYRVATAIAATAVY